MADAVKFCTTCKHRREKITPPQFCRTDGMWWWKKDVWSIEYESIVCAAPRYEYVTGTNCNTNEDSHWSCDWMRSPPYGLCGPEGKLWEEK